MALFRNGLSRILQQTRKVLFFQRPLHHLHLEDLSYDEIEDKFLKYFNRQDIDGWDLRQGMNDLSLVDMIPEPRTICAALYACRRLNEYAVAVRFLEYVKYKCADDKNAYGYLVQEIAPTLCELGIDTPEVLGFHKPELYMKSVFSID